MLPGFRNFRGWCIEGRGRIRGIDEVNNGWGMVGIAGLCTLGACGGHGEDGWMDDRGWMAYVYV